MWLLTRSPVASAAISDSSPASTEAATTRASCAAWCPGRSRHAPRTPSSPSAAACGGSTVPPPTVPTSSVGMVTLTCRSSPRGPCSSMSVMQLELSTTWATSCPVAMNTAATMLAACALKPPILPATAEPVRFLVMLRSTMRSGVVLSTRRTTSPVSTASHTTLFPRPSTQLMAAGFLSAHTLPEMEMTSTSGKAPTSCSRAAFTPLETMFMPMASPVEEQNRRKQLRPATMHLIVWSRAYEDVALKADARWAKLASSSTQNLSAAARATFGMRRAGARVMPSRRSSLLQPPDKAIAFMPRFVLAGLGGGRASACTARRHCTGRPDMAAGGAWGGGR
mmetsp:Transcript_13948/g.44264  ORF Transcript_13948/g.44264 Transcript_13948/m.44264 type:complete len:337 (+) Transcript_13948:205-1215(+)